MLDLSLKEQGLELAKCESDVWHFLTNYAYILDRSKGIVKFLPWKHLYLVVQTVEGHTRIVILKARQIGISWLMAGIGLHTALFKPGSAVLFFSRREAEAIEMKERAKFMWRNLPDWMRQPIGKDNDELLTFPVMDSKIQSFPAVEGSGRSESATLLVLDEWAYHRYAEEIYSATLPAVEHGTLIGVSTANGMGNLFANIYWEARRGENSFVPIFFPYDVLPGRNEEWWNTQKSDMPLYLALQEYPKEEADAFMVAGTCMFSAERLHEATTFDADRRIGQAEIYNEYDPTHSYMAGVDTALGVAGGDFSCCHIIDEFTGDLAARLRARIPLDQFVDNLYQLLVTYGEPFVTIEEQPQGRYVAKGLIDRKYKKHRLYHQTKDNPTWRSTETLRHEVLAELEEAIRTKQYHIHCKETVSEFLQFGYNAEKRKFEALSGHDDEVIASALAWHGKVAGPIKLNDFTPKSYIGGTSGIVTVDDVDWSNPDPFEGLTVVECPVCEGERFVDNEPCHLCDGLGRVMVKANNEGYEILVDAER